MITIDELFEQPFIPEWMTRKKRLAQEQQALLELERQRAELFDALSYNRATGPVIDERFRAAATASRMRISARCDPRGNYANMPKTPAAATGVRRWRTLRKTK